MGKESRTIIGSIIELREEYREQYIILHKHVFPKVLDRIKLSNISEYSIFLHGNLLFSVVTYTGDDYENDMKAIAMDSVTQEWWKLTNPMQISFELSAREINLGNGVHINEWI